MSTSTLFPVVKTKTKKKKSRVRVVKPEEGVGVILHEDCWFSSCGVRVGVSSDR